MTQDKEDEALMDAALAQTPGPIAIGSPFYARIRSSPDWRHETTKEVLSTGRFGSWKGRPVFIIPGSRTNPALLGPRPLEQWMVLTRTAPPPTT